MPERVVICGAGVIGGAIAYYLAKRGTIATIIESDAVAAGASGAAAGWLPSPPPSTTANTTYQLQRLGIDMHQEMARKLPAGVRRRLRVPAATEPPPRRHRGRGGCGARTCAVAGGRGPGRPLGGSG